MKLLIDAGNTRAKYAFDDQGQLSAIDYLTLDTLHDVLTPEVLNQLQSVLIAAVGQSDLLGKLSALLSDAKIPVELLTSATCHHGVTNSYQRPEKLGVDRWLAMLGAKQKFSQDNVLIIDAGTATTIDLVDVKGQHQGGWILPGLQLMRGALYGETEKVQGDSQDIEHIAFADNTSLAVNQGVMAATIGGVEQAIGLASEFTKINGGKLVVVLTGGDAKQIQPLLPVKPCLIPALIFIGMQQYC